MKIFRCLIFGFLITIVSTTFVVASVSTDESIKTLTARAENTLIGHRDAIIHVSFLDSSQHILTNINQKVDLLVAGKLYPVNIKKGEGILKIHGVTAGSLNLQVSGQDNLNCEVKIRKLPAWFSILPPLIAIILAIVFKEVIIALFAGVYLGILLLLGPSDPINWLRAPLVFSGDYLIRVLTNPEKISVIAFSLMIGGMVGLLMKNGSMRALVESMAHRIRTRRRTLFVTWLMGIIIFFDDYANTMIVGNSLRPLTDKFKISREKLAYIVDSTAAPVASVAMITTWIGAQINYISDANAVLNLDESAYSVFLNSLQYAFYPLLTLVFIIVLIITKKDFGPMLVAEKLALKDFNHSISEREHTSSFDDQQKAGTKIRWYDAVIPVAGLVILAFLSLLFYKGSELTWENKDLVFSAKIMHVIGDADPFRALLWASFFGLSLASLITLLKRSLNIRQLVEGVLDGFKSMLIAMIILVMAWSLGILTIEMGTDVYLSSLLSKHIQPFLIPTMVFIIAAAISFATGSSWGTMALLYPMILPAAYNTCILNGIPHEHTMHIFYMVVSAVLGGSVFGDHCSPISDTTILSSMSSGCNHIYHVKTQLPYAITVAIASIVFGYFLSAWLNISSLLGFGICVSMLILVIFIFGKKLVEH